MFDECFKSDLFRHDYTHCLDAEDACPDDCFRKEITFEIREVNGRVFKIPVTCANLLGTSMCPRKES